MAVLLFPSEVAPPAQALFNSSRAPAFKTAHTKTFRLLPSFNLITDANVEEGPPTACALTPWMFGLQMMRPE
jgi:hypothetical protein